MAFYLESPGDGANAEAGLVRPDPTLARTRRCRPYHDCGRFVACSCYLCSGRGHVDNPYVGIVVFLVLPAVFFPASALIPLGVYLGKRRIKRGLEDAAFERKAALQRLAWFIGVTTFLNVLIGTQITYRAVKHMETPQFCGQSCHSMKSRIYFLPECPAFRDGMCGVPCSAGGLRLVRQ